MQDRQKQCECETKESVCFEGPSDLSGNSHDGGRHIGTRARLAIFGVFPALPCHTCHLNPMHNNRVRRLIPRGVKLLQENRQNTRSSNLQYERKTYLRDHHSRNNATACARRELEQTGELVDAD